MLYKSFIDCIVRVLRKLGFEYNDKNMALVVKILYEDKNEYLMNIIDDLQYYDRDDLLYSTSFIKALLNLKIIDMDTKDRWVYGIFSEESDNEEILII